MRGVTSTSLSFKWNCHNRTLRSDDDDAITELSPLFSVFVNGGWNASDVILPYSLGREKMKEATGKLRELLLLDGGNDWQVSASGIDYMPSHQYEI